MWNVLILAMAFLRRSQDTTPAGQARKLLEEAREYRERWYTYPPHPWFLRARTAIKQAGLPLPEVIAEPPGALEFPDFVAALERIACGER